MIKDNEPYLIEYNVRMGDPECQTILPLLKSDFLEIILACCDRKLDEIDIQWSDKKSLCVVLCSKGYPDTYEKNIEISGLDKLNLEHDSFIFHAGTTIKNDKTIVNGGRVLNFVSISDNYLTSRNTIIDKIEKLNWSGGFYRSDIGFKIIK
jgi:phosphoribosylamine--glycine ligase